ncbi:tail fiber domain-containing protein [uncultured Duncaniella sp.]|uniref:tail fiber domain-containing protein n=1 Tax=uncultured Duncaniella sp. TaxID=2768039 RepID=UPI00267615C1|nr:tail fiber domain-containing protein [uncultured Duncaniella sp.]
MKKTTALLMCAAIAVTASAQLKVASNGQIRVGDDKGLTTNISPAAIGVDPGVGVVIPSRFPNDTVSTIHVGGKGMYDSGGLIMFGYRGHVSIGESNYDSSAIDNDGVLELEGKGGVRYISGGNTIFSYDPIMRTIGAVTKSTFTFTPSVSAPQYLTTSDARCKTDIEPLEDIGSQLRDIVPVSYTLVQETGAENQDAPAGAPRKSGAQQNTQHQYGFLAQDVREVYPELVYEDSEGMLSIDYTGFIPILVDAIQNLQTLSEEQAALISAQAEAIAVLKGEKLPGHDEDSVVASLSQNRPNPFRASTVINCVLPEDVSDAFLCVYDLNGNQKMRRDISGRGSVDITIEGNTLNAGMYIYTLIADGIEIGSKRMILTD